VDVRKGLILVCALLACAARPAAAGLVSVGLAGGTSVPVDKVSDAFDNGITGQGFIKFNIPFIITPRLDFTFQNMDITDPTVVAPDFTPGTYTGGTQEIFSGLAHAQFDLIHAGPITPYLIVGVGISNLNTSLDDVSGESTSHNTTQTTVDGGAGVAVKVGPVKAFLEGRLSNVMNNGELIDFDSVQTVPVTLGVVLF
jgi:opacity protein-like surface antigen